MKIIKSTDEGLPLISIQKKNRILIGIKDIRIKIKCHNIIKIKTYGQSMISWIANTGGPKQITMHI